LRPAAVQGWEAIATGVVPKILDAFLPPSGWSMTLQFA